MKRLLPLLSIAAILVFTGETTAQTATCQDLVVQLDNTGNYSFAVGSTTPQVDVNHLTPAGIFNGTSVWQSFFPLADGVLYSGTILFSATYAPTTTTTVNIYDGQGTGGTLIASFSYSNPIAFASGPAEFILDESVDVISGNEYTIEIVDDNGDVMQIRKGSSYAGTAGGVGSITSADDLAFSTKILRRPDIDNGSTAMAGLASFGVDISSFTCSNIGANTVTLTVTDNTSSSTTCTSIVTVEDVDLPTAVCKDISVNLDANGDATIVATDIDNGSSDNCSITYSADVTAFNCGDIGINTVTLTVTDPASNSDQCTSTVTVSDVTDPTASCQNFTLFLDGSGSGTLLVSNINNGSSDNCAIATTSLDQTSFNCGDLGTNTVTLTVSDVNGLVSSCTATVTVADNQTPSITCPSDIVECAVDASGMLVSYSAAIGSDNCGFTITQTDGSGLTSGNTFPIGSTIQEWTITDAALNVSSCSFTVSVNATPVADYSFSPSCLSESIFFTDESTIDPSTSIVSWTWNMDDGSGPITLVDPTHVFAALGSYDVSLLVETPEGCFDVVTQTVDVTPVPVAGFTFVEGCEGNATVFTNTSTIVTGTLTYAWDFGDSNTSTDASSSNVYALDGTYTVTLTVTSDNGCEDEISHSVTVDNSPTALFTATTECEGFATEFTNLSTGDGVLSHSWDFGDLGTSLDTNPTHTYATAGNYTVVLSVTNSNGCVNTHTVNVLVNALPTVDFTFSNVCEGSTASFVNASSSGTYTWDLGDGSSSSLTNVNHDYTTFGFYDVTLTVTDANFCINTGTQQIEIYDLPDFTLTPTDVLCFGESTGAINTTPVGSPAFPWTLSLNGATPVSNGNFSNLPAGNYDVTAYDVNGCEFTASTVVSQPNEALGINVISFDDILCNGDNTGAISVTGTGGTAPYSYSLDLGSPQVNGTFSGLVAGVHAVQITDNNLCVFDTVITLTEPAVLVLGSVNAEDLLCNGDNSGLVEVAATGGVTPYMYSIDGGSFANTSTFNGLAAGLHILGVLDANGCTDTVHVTLSEPGILQLSILASADANCFGESSGSIETQAASGTAPYQYSLDGVSFVGSGTFEGLSAGTYTITVRDANGCLDNVTETIFEPSVLTIETSSEPVSCFGDASGMIEIIATGGTPNYQYSSNGGGLFVQNGGQFTDVVAGTYLAVVLDANGCSASEGVIVSQPTSVFVISANVTNAACLNEASGSVQLIGAGGTPTYTYSNDNTTFGTSTVFEDFAAGVYTLYAKDINGCVDSVNVTISQPSTAVSINNTILNNPACPNSQTGTVTVQAGGGTPPYMYSSNGGGTYQNGQFLFGVGGGNHLIFVMDANGCTDSDTVTLISPPLLDFIIDTVIGVPCENNFSGEIHVTAIGGTPSYNYMLNGGSLQSNGDYVNLTSGNYVVAITDVNSCVHSESFTIVADQLLPEADFGWSVSGTAVLFSNNSDFEDTYLWSFGDDSTSTEESPVHVYAEDGDYNVSLTVSNACGSAVVSYNVSTTALGISDSEQIAFGIYPNPASTLLFLQSSITMNEKLSLEVISISGQLINSLQISGIDANEAMSVDVSSLSNGMYYLRIVGQDQSSVLRFDIIK